MGYWEPAKFVAKLREYKTDNNMLLFKCEMGAGVLLSAKHPVYGSHSWLAPLGVMLKKALCCMTAHTSEQYVLSYFLSMIPI